MLSTARCTILLREVNLVEDCDVLQQKLIVISYRLPISFHKLRPHHLIHDLLHIQYSIQRMGDRSAEPAAKYFIILFCVDVNGSLRF